MFLFLTKDGDCNFGHVIDGYNTIENVVIKLNLIRNNVRKICGFMTTIVLLLCFSN